MSIRMATLIIMFTSKKYHPIYVKKDSLEKLPQSFFLSGHTIAYLYTIGKYLFLCQKVYKTLVYNHRKRPPAGGLLVNGKRYVSILYVF